MLGKHNNYQVVEDIKEREKMLEIQSQSKMEQNIIG